MSSDARLFDMGYRRYEGERQAPWRAMPTLAWFTAKRVLGVGRGGRHKVLPAITLAIAYMPALGSVAFAVIANNIIETDLISYGAYMVIIATALALFAALVAPEALCPDRRSGMLGLYLAGPLDRARYLVAKAAGVIGVMLLITMGPLLFMLTAFVLAGFGPKASETPKLVLQIVVAGGATALLYASLAMAVSSFTTRRAVAAVGTILLILVPAVVLGAATDAGAPNRLMLLSPSVVVADLARRIFGEGSKGAASLLGTPTLVVAGASALAILAGFGACWLRYRRIEAFR